MQIESGGSGVWPLVKKPRRIRPELVIRSGTLSKVNGLSVFFAHSRNQLTLWRPSILLSKRAVGMSNCHANREADTTLTLAPALITGLLPISKAQPSPTTSALIPGLSSWPSCFTLCHDKPALLTIFLSPGALLPNPLLIATWGQGAPDGNFLQPRLHHGRPLTRLLGHHPYVLLSLPLPTPGCFPDW